MFGGGIAAASGKLKLPTQRPYPAGSTIHIEIVNREPFEIALQGYKRFKVPSEDRLVVWLAQPALTLFDEAWENIKDACHRAPVGP